MIRPHLFKILFRELTAHTDVRSWLAQAPPSDLHLVLDKLAEAERAMVERKEDPETEYKKMPLWCVISPLVFA